MFSPSVQPTVNLSALRAPLLDGADTEGSDRVEETRKDGETVNWRAGPTVCDSTFMFSVQDQDKLRRMRP